MACTFHLNKLMISVFSQKKVRIICLLSLSLFHQVNLPFLDSFRYNLGEEYAKGFHLCENNNPKKRETIIYKINDNIRVPTLVLIFFISTHIMDNDN